MNKRKANNKLNKILIGFPPLFPLYFLPPSVNLLLALFPFLPSPLRGEARG